MHWARLESSVLPPTHPSFDWRVVFLLRVAQSSYCQRQRNALSLAPTWADSAAALCHRLQYRSVFWSSVERLSCLLSFSTDSDTLSDPPLAFCPLFDPLLFSHWVALWVRPMLFALVWKKKRSVFLRIETRTKWSYFFVPRKERLNLTCINILCLQYLKLWYRSISND